MEKNRGQITILVTLLSLLGLTVALSLASKTLEDIKQVSYVDAGTRAFAGAEAGLQRALKDVGDGSGIPQGQTDCNTAPVNDITSALSLTGLKSTAGLTYKTCRTSGAAILNAPNVARDDVIQFDASGWSTANPNLKSFDVNWSGNAAVEIIVIDKDDNTSNYTLRRYAYNGHNNILSNGFATGMAATPSNCIADATCTCYTGVNDNITGTGEICYRPNCALSGQPHAQVVRIKPFYQDASVSVCGRDSTGANSSLSGPTASYSIIVTATAANGTVRRLQTSRAAGSSGLPTVFDSVFFSFDNISK